MSLEPLKVKNVRPTKGGTFLFLGLGLFALSLPAAGGFSVYRKLGLEHRLRVEGVTVTGTVSRKSMKYRVEPLKGSGYEISGSEYERINSGRSTVSQGTSTSITYVLEYSFTTRDGRPIRGRSVTGSRSLFDAHAEGAPIRIRYLPNEPRKSEVEAWLEVTLGYKLFWIGAVLLMGLFSLPGLFLLYTAWRNERMRLAGPA